MLLLYYTILSRFPQIQLSTITALHNILYVLHILYPLHNYILYIDLNPFFHFLRKQENTRVLLTLSHTIINLNYMFTRSIGDLFHLYIVFNTILYIICYYIVVTLLILVLFISLYFTTNYFYSLIF